jgi:hypothetical protein
MLHNTIQFFHPVSALDKLIQNVKDAQYAKAKSIIKKQSTIIFEIYS